MSHQQQTTHQQQQQASGGVYTISQAAVEHQMTIINNQHEQQHEQHVQQHLDQQHQQPITTQQQIQQHQHHSHHHPNQNQNPNSNLNQQQISVDVHVDDGDDRDEGQGDNVDVGGGGSGGNQSIENQSVVTTKTAIINQQPTATNQIGSRIAPETNQQQLVYNIHPLLQLLDEYDTLLIRQSVDHSDTCCGLESENTYTIRSKSGVPLLKAVESSSCCERCCCEESRKFQLTIMLGDEILCRVSKSSNCTSCLCYKPSTYIESPLDNRIGSIRQQFVLFGHSNYAIYDRQHQPNKPIFYLKPTTCRYCCTPLFSTCLCSNNQFSIYQADNNEEIGQISRHWSTNDMDIEQFGFATTGTTNEQQPETTTSTTNKFCRDVFGIYFFPNLETRHKVLLLASCFMMDFLYFDKDRRSKKIGKC